VLVIRSFGSDKNKLYKHNMIIYYTEAVQWNSTWGTEGCKTGCALLLDWCSA